MIEDVAIRRRKVEMREGDVVGWLGGLFDFGAQGHRAVRLSDQACALSRGVDGLTGGVLAKAREGVLQLDGQVREQDFGGNARIVTRSVARRPVVTSGMLGDRGDMDVIAPGERSKAHRTRPPMTRDFLPDFIRDFLGHGWGLSGEVEGCLS